VIVVVISKMDENMNLNIDWIDADILAELMKTDDDDNNKSDMLIVDVRDDDYGSSSIKNAINVPSTTFDNDDTKLNLLKYIKEKDKKVIIFHCMKSQVRGPTCAESFKSYINKTTNGEDITIQGILLFYYSILFTNYFMYSIIRRI